MNEPFYVPADGGSARAVVGVALASALMAAVATLALVMAFGVGTPAAAPSASGAGAQPAGAIRASDGSDLAAVVARAKHSVVTVTAQGIGDTGFSAFDLPSTGVGSGIVVSADGLILTNSHVVDGASSLTITTEDGATLEATVVDTDAAKDIAIIRAAATDLTPATLADSTHLAVGQTV